MLYWLLGSLATSTAMLALFDPPPAGVKVTATVHDEFAAAAAPHVPPVTAKSLAFAPLKLSLMGSENPDRLVTVTLSVFDGVLDVSLPYASLTGVTVAGIVGLVLSATVCGPSRSGLSETESVADSAPRAPGVNVTAIVHAL